MVDLILTVECFCILIVMAYFLATAGMCCYKAVRKQDKTYSIGTVIYLLVFVILYNWYPFL